MSARSGPDPQNGYPAVIKVLGVGGAGCDAVNRMVQAGISGVEFIAVNTDRQVLRQSKAHGRIEIGGTGLGAGGDPEKGRAFAEESADDIRQALEGSDMVFVTGGMGGGTGTGAAPVVARIAKALGALTVGVVTRPFDFEGERKQGYADQGSAALSEHVDALVVIRLDRLFSILDEAAPLHEFHSQAGETLRKSVQAITDVITTTGVANVDFADIRSMMEGAGEALMGIGEARGAPNSGRAIEAANLALHSPLLADVTIAGAKGIIVNITGGKDITGYELKEVMTQI
ncbi:MAG: cell division protein FtsZ, partial [bacterium]